MMSFGREFNVLRITFSPIVTLPTNVCLCFYFFGPCFIFLDLLFPEQIPQQYVYIIKCRPKKKVDTRTNQ